MFKQVLRVTVTAALLGVMCLSAPPNWVHAGEAQGQGEYLAQASARLIKLVDASNAQGFKLNNNSFSLGGGWLTQGNNWVPLFTVKLVEDRDYRCLAAGDNDARDVDLQIVDSNGQVIAQDTAADPQAVVTFRPKATGEHLVRLRLYASQKNVPCACLGVVMAK